MKVRLKFWPAYWGKWEVYETTNDRFGNKEVDIDENLLSEYAETVDKLKKLTSEIWSAYNDKP